MRVILTVLAVPGFALGLAIAAGELKRGEVPDYGQPTSLVWADRVYSNKRDFAAWLRSRGVRYRAWAAKHPDAAGILEGRSTSDRLKRTAAAASPTVSRHTGLALTVVFGSLLGLLALVATRRTGIPRLALARHRRDGPPPETWSRRRTGKSVRQRASASHRLQNSVALTRQRLAGVERHVASGQPRDAGTPVAVDVEWRVDQLPASGHFTGIARDVYAVAARIAISVARCVDEFAQRVRPPRGAADDASEQAWLLAQRLRHQVPNVAFYVVSVLLGLVVGVSIVIYAN